MGGRGPTIPASSRLPVRSGDLFHPRIHAAVYLSASVLESRV